MSFHLMCVLIWVLVKQKMSESYWNFFKSLSLELKTKLTGFPGGAVVENLPANAGDTGSSPGPGRSHMPRSN